MGPAPHPNRRPKNDTAAGFTNLLRSEAGIIVVGISICTALFSSSLQRNDTRAAMRRPWHVANKFIATRKHGIHTAGAVTSETGNLSVMSNSVKSFYRPPPPALALPAPLPPAAPPPVVLLLVVLFPPFPLPF